MVEERTKYASAEEIAQLRDEVKRLKEAQERQKGSGGDRKEADNKEADRKVDDHKEQEEAKKAHPRRKLIAIAAALVIAAIGLVWWLHARNFENTDDAFV